MKIAEAASIAASEALKHLELAELYLDRKGFNDDAKSHLTEVKKELKALHKKVEQVFSPD